MTPKPTQTDGTPRQVQGRRKTYPSEAGEAQSPAHDRHRVQRVTDHPLADRLVDVTRVERAPRERLAHLIHEAPRQSEVEHRERDVAPVGAPNRLHPLTLLATVGCDLVVLLDHEPHLGFPGTTPNLVEVGVSRVRRRLEVVEVPVEK